MMAPTPSKPTCLLIDRSPADARSGRSAASTTMARGRRSIESSSWNKSAGSSHRSSVRTSAPKLRRMFAAPPSRSMSGPWPTTAMNEGPDGTYASLPDLGTPNRDLRNLDRWAPDADRDALPVLAARPDTIRNANIMTQHHYISKRFGTVSDEVHAFERRRQLAVFDEVTLGQRKHEVAVRNVDLSTPELLGKNAVFDALHDVFRLVLPGQEDGVGHAGHRVAGETFAPSVAGGSLLEVLGAQAVVHVAAQDAVLDEHAAGGLVPFVVDVDG